MSFKDKYEISEEFSSLFEFKSEKEELKHDAYMLMFKFLSEIQRVNDYTIHKKDLANAIDSSRSYVSQLFSGDKLANLITLAKLQKAYNITFEVKAKLNDANLLNSFVYWNNEKTIPESLLQNSVNNTTVAEPDRMVA